MQEILIVGASARAAAFSALRAGFAPVCVDLFGDVDLQTVAQCHVVNEYPGGIPEIAGRLKPMPFIFTGALENHPGAIQQISARHTLMGTPAEKLRRAGDPHLFAMALRDAELPFLEVSDSRPLDCKADDLIWKPRRGAGGRAISRTTAGNESGYWQRFVDGPSVSAIYLASRTRTEFVGATLQLVGLSSLNAPRFSWCGSIGPISLGSVSQTLPDTGLVAAATFGLRGLFGIDFICNSANSWPVEINPRYTGSVEVHELATGRPLLIDHLAACDGKAEFPAKRAGNSAALVSLTTGPVTGRVIGKAILFARHAASVCDLQEIELPTSVALADVPAAGLDIQAGHPVCSLLAAGDTLASCADRLASGVEEMNRTIFGIARPADDIRTAVEPFRTTSN